MTFELNDEEWSLLENLPVETLIDLAADLDVVVPAELNRRALASRCVPLMVTRAMAHGLPLSKYDQADVEALERRERDALAHIQGLKPGASVRAILKAGDKAYRVLSKSSGGASPFATMVPILLGPMVRHALQIGVNNGV